MRKINLEEYVSDFIEVIEDYKKENNIEEIDFPELIKLNNDHFLRLVAAAKCMGIKFTATDAEIMNIRHILVPKESELFYIDRNGKSINLCGVEIAKMFKSVFVRVLSACTSISEEIVEQEITIKYKVYDKYIEYDEFIKNFNDILNSPDLKNIVDHYNTVMGRIADSSSEHKENLLYALKEFNTVQQYGIYFDLQSYYSKFNGDEDLNDRSKRIVNIEVPESSKYLYCGEEVAGECAFRLAMDTIYRLFDKDILNDFEFDYKIIEGLHWDSEKYMNEKSRLDKITDIFGSTILQ